MAAAACHGTDEPSADELVLRRQVSELRKLVAAPSASLFDFDQILVVVDQGLVQRLLSRVLPLEGDAGGFRLRMDEAKAAFGDGIALLRLAGEARMEEGQSALDFQVYGGLEVVELHPSSGILRARVRVYAVEIPKARILGMNGPARRLAEVLREGGLETLLGPIEVPVRIEDHLQLPAVKARHVSIPALDVPVAATVTKVRVFGGKLFVGLRARLETDGRGCASPAP